MAVQRRRASDGMRRRAVPLAAVAAAVLLVLLLAAPAAHAARVGLLKRPILFHNRQDKTTAAATAPAAGQAPAPAPRPSTVLVVTPEAARAMAGGTLLLVAAPAAAAPSAAQGPAVLLHAAAVDEGQQAAEAAAEAATGAEVQNERAEEAAAVAGPAELPEAAAASADATAATASSSSAAAAPSLQELTTMAVATQEPLIVHSSGSRESDNSSGGSSSGSSQSERSSATSADAMTAHTVDMSGDANAQGRGAATTADALAALSNAYDTDGDDMLSMRELGALLLHESAAVNPAYYAEASGAGAGPSAGGLARAAAAMGAAAAAADSAAAASSAGGPSSAASAPGAPEPHFAFAPAAVTPDVLAGLAGLSDGTTNSSSSSGGGGGGNSSIPASSPQTAALVPTGIASPAAAQPVASPPAPSQPQPQQQPSSAAAAAAAPAAAAPPAPGALVWLLQSVRLTGDALLRLRVDAAVETLLREAIRGSVSDSAGVARERVGVLAAANVTLPLAFRGVDWRAPAAALALRASLEALGRGFDRGHIAVAFDDDGSGSGGVASNEAAAQLPGLSRASGQARRLLQQQQQQQQQQQSQAERAVTVTFSDMSVSNATSLLDALGASCGGPSRALAAGAPLTCDRELAAGLRAAGAVPDAGAFSARLRGKPSSAVVLTLGLGVTRDELARGAEARAAGWLAGADLRAFLQSLNLTATPITSFASLLPSGAVVSGAGGTGGGGAGAPSITVTIGGQGGSGSGNANSGTVKRFVPPALVAGVAVAGGISLAALAGVAYVLISRRSGGSGGNGSDKRQRGGERGSINVTATTAASSGLPHRQRRPIYNAQKDLASALAQARALQVDGASGSGHNNGDENDGSDGSDNGSSEVEAQETGAAVGIGNEARAAGTPDRAERRRARLAGANSDASGAARRPSAASGSLPHGLERGDSVMSAVRLELDAAADEAAEAAGDADEGSAAGATASPPRGAAPLPRRQSRRHPSLPLPPSRNASARAASSGALPPQSLEETVSASAAAAAALNASNSDTDDADALVSQRRGGGTGGNSSGGRRVDDGGADAGPNSSSGGGGAKEEGPLPVRPITGRLASPFATLTQEDAFSPPPSSDGGGGGAEHPCMQRRHRY